MANQVIVANSKYFYTDQQFGTIAPLSGGVTQFPTGIPEAVMIEACSASGSYAYTLTQEILTQLMRNTEPLRSFRPDYSHKEIGTLRNSPVSAGSSAGSGANALTVIPLAAQSFSDTKTNARVNMLIWVGSVPCRVHAVTPGTPTTISVYPIVLGQTVPATSANQVLGYYSNADEIGRTNITAQTPEIGYYTFTNYIQTFDTPLMSTDSEGMTLQDTTMFDDFIKLSPISGSKTSAWLSFLRKQVPMSEDADALFITKAAKLAYLNHSMDVNNAFLFGRETTNSTMIAAMGKQVYTTKGLIPSIEQYGSQHSYVGATGMTQALFQSIAAEAIYYGYKANNYMMFMPQQLRLDFQNYIINFTTTFNMDNVNLTGFPEETRQYVNTTFSGIQIDNRNYWMHREFDPAANAALSATQYTSKSFFIPMIDSTPDASSTQVLHKVVKTNGTGDFNAQTGIPTPSHDPVYDGGIKFDWAGSQFGGAPSPTTLDDYSRMIMREKAGILIKHAGTMGMITRT